MRASPSGPGSREGSVPVDPGAAPHPFLTIVYKETLHMPSPSVLPLDEKSEIRPCSKSIGGGKAFYIHTFYKCILPYLYSYKCMYHGLKQTFREERRIKYCCQPSISFKQPEEPFSRVLLLDRYLL